MSPSRGVGVTKEPRSDATCRTCKGCRLKKVRCDGHRPQCRACRLRGQNCEYPQDARRRSGKGRTGIRQLEKELQELRNQLSLTGSGASKDVSINDDPTISRVHSGESDRNLTTIPVLRSPQSAPVRSSHSSPTHARESSHNGQGPLGACSFVVESACPHPDPHEEIQVSSPESVVEYNEDRIYGATNILHIQSSEQLFASLPVRDSSSDSRCLKATQHELISNAAIGRQTELTILSVPSVAHNIDFDGVPIDLAMHLLNLHWNRQHNSYLLTYRPAIMDSLISNGPYSSKLLLNAIYYSSCLYSGQAFLYLHHPDPQTSAKAFYDRFKLLLADYIEKPSMPTIVALLLVGSIIVPQGKQSAGWTFCGMAYRMITDLGYDLDVSTTPQRPNGNHVKLSACELEIRKRVFWGAYVCDKFQSIFLGRSPALHAATAMSQEYLDTYEELEEWKPYADNLVESDRPTNPPPYPGRPSYTISSFGNLLRICSIASRIIDEFYSIAKTDPAEVTILQSRQELRDLLDEWKQRLPQHLQFDPSTDATPPPHQITPHTTYWMLIILLEQPFLNRGHFSFGLGSQQEAREKCIQAALEIWKLVEAYKRTFTLRRAQYSISYASYCAVFVMLQQAPRECAGYAECVRFFWNALLEFQKGCSAGLKRPLRLLKSLMARVETVGGEGHLAKQHNSHGWESTSESGVFCHGDMQFWHDLGLDSIPDDLSFADDTIFGMFT